MQIINLEHHMAFPARLADPGFPGSEKRRESSDAILRMQNVEDRSWYLGSLC